MTDISTLRDLVQDLSAALRTKYQVIEKLSPADLKVRLEETMGTLYRLDPLTDEEVQSLAPLVGVDGSNVRKGGAYPHYLDIFQGLAKPTQGDPIYTQKVYTPLLAQEGREEARSLTGRYLAAVELEVALLSVEKIHPRVLMLDGGFIRFNISAPTLWEDLVEACLDEDVLLIGAIKETKTHMIGEDWGYGDQVFDRDLLHGKLDVGDFFLVHDEKNSKGDQGFSSGFFRASHHPEVVGLDMLREQKDAILDMARLLMTLTPTRSRGVNFWIDMVDKEVKLTHEFIEVLLEENLDRDLYERFFVSERDRRD